MFDRCLKCGTRLVVSGLLCITCSTSTAALPVGASVSIPPHRVVAMAIPPVDPESPHAPDEWPTDHIGSATMSAGGGGTIQAGVELTGEGHLTAGGPIGPGASLSGEGSLTAGGPIMSGVSLSGGGSLTTGGPVIPGASLTGSGSLTAG